MSYVISSLLRHALPKSLGLLLIAGSVLAIGDRVNAMTIEGWKYDPEKGQVELEIADGVKPRHFLMAQPARIVVDLQETQIGNAPAQMTYTSGPIQKITVEQLQPQLTRVTLYMFPSAVFARGQVAIERVGDGTRGTSDVWTLRPLLKGMEVGTTPTQPPLQIKTQSQTLTQTQPAQTPAPISQSIPIAVPVAKSEVAPIADRFAGVRPATPPQLEDMPPGMASVVQPSKVPAPIVQPVPTAVKPFALPTKIETVKPEAVKPETPVVIPIATPKIETVKPETPKPEIPKIALAKPEVSKVEAVKPVTIVPISAPVAPVAVPVVVPVPAAPPSVTTLFPPTIAAPVSVSIPIAVPAPQSPQVLAKAENIVLPDSLPTLAPTGVTQPGTVSVPPLNTIPSVPAVPAQPMAPLPSPAAQPIVPRSSTPVFSFPLPDRLPQQSPQQSPQPLYQPSTSQSFPLPDRIPTVLPNQPAPQSVQQPSLFPTAGIAQPVDRNPIASNPATVQPNVISFGQPLVTSVPPSTVTQTPLQSSPFNATPTGAIVAMNSSDGRMGLPAGTTLMVRYTGISPIVVKGESRKEILTLQSAIRDRNGTILAPEGTTIYGSFVGKENRFVAESIVLQGQTISLVAESPSLGGARNPSERSLLQNSGIGLLAGVLIGGLSGGNAVGGAAAGAIVSYATAPKVATIQPGQTLELKLTQDWIIPFGASVSQAVGG
jgi:hypothetical protein